MFVKWPLIRWQMRQARNFNLVLSFVVATYVLMRWEPFDSAWTFAWWFPAVHAAVIPWILGRSTTPAAGFLHLQGFSRDALWWHTVASAAGCVLCVWLPAAILLLTPLRGAWQDLLQNPSFPYMAPVEHRIAWLVLWEYAICVPLTLYAAARWAHPARGNDAGLVCAMALIVLFVGNLTSVRPAASGFALSENWILYAGSLLIAGIALVTGRDLFRNREVQP